jgi:hypothetical protein
MLQYGATQVQESPGVTSTFSCQLRIEVHSEVHSGNTDAPHLTCICAPVGLPPGKLTGSARKIG